MLRRGFFMAALFAFLVPALAQASGPVSFDATAFAAAQAAGKPILVHIHADWCPVCARQGPILGALEQTPEFSDLVVFNVDFDSQKNVVRQLGAQMQGTLIVFRGTAEKGRSTGETDAGKIKALLERSKLS
jgi:thioredoxin 1